MDFITLEDLVNFYNSQESKCYSRDLSKWLHFETVNDIIKNKKLHLIHSNSSLLYDVEKQDYNEICVHLKELYFEKYSESVYTDVPGIQDLYKWIVQCVLHDRFLNDKIRSDTKMKNFLDWDNPICNFKELPKFFTSICVSSCFKISMYYFKEGYMGIGTEDKILAFKINYSK